VWTHANVQTLKKLLKNKNGSLIMQVELKRFEDHFCYILHLTSICVFVTLICSLSLCSELHEKQRRILPLEDPLSDNEQMGIEFLNGYWWSQEKTSG
jgi:hypothetical protein